MSLSKPIFIIDDLSSNSNLKMIPDRLYDDLEPYDEGIESYHLHSYDCFKELISSTDCTPLLEQLFKYLLEQYDSPEIDYDFNPPQGYVGFDEFDNLFTNSNAIYLAKKFPFWKSNYLHVKVCWLNFSKFIPTDIGILIEDLNEEDWKLLSSNSNSKAISILEENLDKVYWPNILENPNAAHIIKQNPNKFDWHYLSKNPNPEIIDIIKQNLDKVDWISLCENTNPEIIPLLKENFDKINWSNISANPIGIDLLKENIEKIDINYLIKNTNPMAIPLLEPHLDKLEEYKWTELSRNPAFIKLLENNLDKVCPDGLVHNKNAIHLLYKYDYSKMSEHMHNSNLFKEFMIKINNPIRVKYYLDKYNYDICYDEYLE